MYITKRLKTTLSVMAWSHFLISVLICRTAGQDFQRPLYSFYGTQLHVQLRSGASLPAPSRAEQNIADMVQSSPLESNRHFLHGNGVRAAHDNLFKPLFSHRGNAQRYLANVLWLWFEHHANAMKVNMNLYLHFTTDISEVNSIFSEKKRLCSISWSKAKNCILVEDRKFISKMCQLLHNNTGNAG